MLSPGDKMFPLNWKMRLPSGHVEQLMPLNQRAKKGDVTLPAGMIGPDYRAENELLLRNEGTGDYIWKPGDSPVSMIKLNGKRQQQEKNQAEILRFHIIQ